MRTFRSALAPFLEDYLTHKRALGYAFKNPGHLYMFDKFYEDNNLTSPSITREAIDAWSMKNPNEADSNRYHRIRSIRDFSIYLNHCGYHSYIPLLPKNYRSTFTPYIFTQDELTRFFNACDSRQEKKRSFNTSYYIYPALFRLLYGTGLRIYEALSIEIKDIDLKEGTIVIRDSKNGEDRLIPLCPSLIVVLSDYKSHYRDKIKSGNLFFVKLNSERVSCDNVYKHFRKILALANISHGGRGYGPRLHDVRHIFSINSLHKMTSEGLDIYYCLPILSQYLGHKSIDATNGYVRITMELYPEMMDKLNQSYSHLFPEVMKS